MSRHDLYAIDVDQERNCYSCEGFKHLARNCRDWRMVGQEKRIKYEDNCNTRDNLKEEESLIVLN